MNKKLVSAILCGAMVLAAATPVMADGGVADGKKIALVGKSAGNAFFEIAANSFKETVEAEGGSVDVVYPEAATADKGEGRTAKTVSGVEYAQPYRQRQSRRYSKD